MGAGGEGGDSRPRVQTSFELPCLATTGWRLRATSRLSACRALAHARAAIPKALTRAMPDATFPMYVLPAKDVLALERLPKEAISGNQSQ